MAIVTAVQNGPFGNPTTWDNNEIPTLGNDYVIPQGITVTLDGYNGAIGSDTGSNDGLTIAGRLEWNCTANSYLKVLGNFRQTSTGEIYFNGTITDQYKLELELATSANQTPEGKYKVYISNKDTWYVEGYNRPSYPIAKIQKPDNTNTLVVLDTTKIQDWKVGDEIVIGESWKPVTITYINGNQITIDQQVTRLIPFIYNVTRNIVFIGDKYSRTPFEYQSGTSFKYVSFRGDLDPSNNVTGYVCCASGWFPNGTINLEYCVGIGRQFSNGYGIRSDRFIGNYIYPGWSGFGGFTLSHTFQAWNTNFLNNIHTRLTVNPKSIDIYDCIFVKSPFTYWNDSNQVKYHKQRNNVFYNCFLLRYDNSNYPVTVDFENCSFNKVSIYQDWPGVRMIGCKFGEYTTDENKLYTKSVLNIQDKLIDNNHTLYGICQLDWNSIAFERTDNTHEYTTYYYIATNDNNTLYNGNKSVKIVSKKTGNSKFLLNVLVEKDTSYKWKLFIRNEQLVTVPPIVRIKNGTTILDEKQLNNISGTWQEIVLSWVSDFNGFIDLEIEFSFDTTNEVYYISDEYNSFEYWKKGHPIPIFPKQVLTNDTISKHVWQYQNRSIDDTSTIVNDVWNHDERSLNTPVNTVKDDDISFIKLVASKFSFTTNNEVYSYNMNPSFKQSDREKLFSLKNYDDTVIRSMIKDIRDMEFGNWTIIDDTIIYYREDGTELARYRLFDDLGRPTAKNAFRRLKIT